MTTWLPIIPLKSVTLLLRTKEAYFSCHKLWLVKPLFVQNQYACEKLIQHHFRLLVDQYTTQTNIFKYVKNTQNKTKQNKTKQNKTKQN
jgi:hypothetical protein